jgi:NAD(P)-dependent dehydrogenase (short-subunit alcohol dehydrogenase family)
MADINTQPLAVITGGASGIGLSAVKRFLDEGYEVLILDANKDAGDQSVNTLNQILAMLILHIVTLLTMPK